MVILSQADWAHHLNTCLFMKLYNHSGNWLHVQSINSKPKVTLKKWECYKGPWLFSGTGSLSLLHFVSYIVQELMDALQRCYPLLAISTDSSEPRMMSSCCYQSWSYEFLRAMSPPVLSFVNVITPVYARSLPLMPSSLVWRTHTKLLCDFSVPLPTHPLGPWWEKMSWNWEQPIVCLLHHLMSNT